MTYPAVTALTASLIALLQIGLMALTINSRYAHKQGLGDGGHPALIARIRSHANLTENAPIVLILLGLLETAGTSRLIVAGLAILFVIARLLHPIGLIKTSGQSLPRFLGVVLTVSVTVISALWLIAIAFERLS